MREVNLPVRGKQVMLATIALLAIAALAVWRVAPMSDLSTDTTPASAAAVGGQESTQAARDPAPTTVSNLRTSPVHSGLEVPMQHALIPSLRVPVADSWQGLLADLTDEERLLAEAFAARYPEAYLFNDVAQLEWMLQNGFPMPEEIVTAARMPIDDLVQLGYNGNSKAAALAIDRLLQDLDAEKPANEWTAEEAERDGRVASLAAQAEQSCSLFASGYSQLGVARLNETRNPGNPGVDTLAVLTYIEQRGDWRVRESIDFAYRSMGLTDPVARGAIKAVHQHYSGLMAKRCGVSSMP